MHCTKRRTRRDAGSADGFLVRTRGSRYADGRFLSAGFAGAFSEIFWGLISVAIGIGPAAGLLYPNFGH